MLAFDKTNPYFVHNYTKGLGMEAKIERRTLTVTEAAEALGVSRNKAYDAARRGEIPTIKIGKRILVPVVALERMLQGPSDGCVGKAV